MFRVLMEKIDSMKEQMAKGIRGVETLGKN